MWPVRIHQLNSIDLHIQNKDHFKSEADGSDGKESACNVADPDLVPGSRRSPGEGNDNPLQYPSGKIPWTEEPDWLQAMGWQRAGHD